ncbi:hypothetical protein BH23GEM6_BH23GEM6_24640 [soil metagenome]
MKSAENPLTDTFEFEDDAAYGWWRDSHPDGFVLTIRARNPPLLHRAVCRDVDRALHPGRLKAKGSRQLCASAKSALRAWLKLENPSDAAQLVARCPKCEP